MRLLEVIKKPIITEKSSAAELKNSTYVLEVSEDATKIDIKKALKEIYWVEVSDVNILHTREKFKQGKKGMVVRKRSTKKAYATLKDASAKLDLSAIKI